MLRCPFCHRQLFLGTNSKGRAANWRHIHAPCGNGGCWLLGGYRVTMAPAGHGWPLVSARLLREDMRGPPPPTAAPGSGLGPASGRRQQAGAENHLPRLGVLLPFPGWFLIITRLSLWALTGLSINSPPLYAGCWKLVFVLHTSHGKAA